MNHRAESVLQLGQKHALQGDTRAKPCLSKAPTAVLNAAHNPTTMQDVPFCKTPPHLPNIIPSGCFNKVAPRNALFALNIPLSLYMPVGVDQCCWPSNDHGYFSHFIGYIYIYFSGSPMVIPCKGILINPHMPTRNNLRPKGQARMRVQMTAPRPFGHTLQEWQRLLTKPRSDQRPQP